MAWHEVLYQQWNLAKHYHTSSSKFNAAFRALRWIKLHRTASNEPSTVTTEQVNLWHRWNEDHALVLPSDGFSGKFHSAHFVLFRNLRLRRSYSTVQTYFIKSLGNNVPWYFNAKVSISSFRDGGCCRKSILFWFITNPSVFPCSSFPGPAMWFLGFSWPSSLKFS